MRAVGVSLGRPKEIVRAAVCIRSSWCMGEGDTIRRTGADYVRAVLINAL